jgi:hypothetical protein
MSGEARCLSRQYRSPSPWPGKAYRNVLEQLAKRFAEFTGNMWKKLGLFGHELRLKLEGFNLAWQKFTSTALNRVLNKENLLKLLEWTIIILGSMKDVPGIEAIKEFVEAVQAAIKAEWLTMPV